MGGGQGDHGRNTQQWPLVDHNTKDPKATPTGPPPDDRPQTGRSGSKKKTTARRETTPTATPQQPATTGDDAP